MTETQTAAPMTKDQAIQLAEAYMDKHKCRWSEACLEIKKRHPEARALFGAPPKLDDENR